MSKTSILKIINTSISIIIILLFSNLQIIVLSQDVTKNKSSLTEYQKTIISYAGQWWVIFSFGIFLVILGILARSSDWLSRILLYGGLTFIFISIFLAQIIYVLPLIPVIKGIDISLCEEITPSNILHPILNYIQYFSCLFSGMAPKADIYSFLIWLIFLFILPLSILIGLFWEFTTPFVIENPNVRKVIAFASALIAYRFLMAYLFVEFISVGFGGIALFFVNILFFGWAVNGIRRLFKFTETVKKMREVQNLAQLERLMRMRDELYAAWEAAVRAGDLKKADEIFNRIQNIDSEIEKFEKEMKKRGEGVKVASAPSYIIIIIVTAFQKCYY